MGHLIGKPQTPHARYCRNPQFQQALDLGLDEVNVALLGGPKIDFDRLPGTRAILDGNLEAYSVRPFHIPSLGLDAKCELVEAQTQGLPQRLEAARASAFHHQIQIFGGAGTLCEAQLHCDTAFETVGAQDALFKRSLEHPIPRLNIPAHNWWSEALHGVSVNGVTEFPEPIGLAAT